VILAFDPGERKIGWALVEADGAPVAQGIWPVDAWRELLMQLPQIGKVDTLVIGDGTARMNIEAELARLLPQCAIAVVGEKESTVEGWQLKRAETCGANPLKSMLFTLRQLFNAPPVDDYAARVLAQRYLAQR
jgi:RNase H-fold protein (predicted Holliday junction resolvase)